MKKKVVTSVIAVLLAAGIGTGVYFGVKSKDKAPQPNAPEVTTPDEPPYGDVKVECSLKDYNGMRLWSITKVGKA